MKRRLFGILLLSAVIVLSGCHKTHNTYVPPENETEPGWADDNSPVPNKRVGLVRAGVNRVDHAVSPAGVYFLDMTEGNDSYVVYADNGSDTFIKLCGRPDCPHNTADCNSYIYDGYALSYYEGYLYAASGKSSDSLDAKLIRMDPDGSNHVTIMDLNKYAKETGGDFAKCNIITDGFCLFSIYQWKVVSEGPDHIESVSSSMGYYYYKLDGSMEAPESANLNGLACYSCGDAFLVHNPTPEEGSSYGSYYDWNPDTNKTNFLTPHPGEPGWYGENEGYYFQNGHIYRIIYGTNKTESMVDTGLEGSYLLAAFPDYLVLVSNASKGTDNNLYFYNWSFELIDTVCVPNPKSQRTSSLLFAETAERILLTTSFDGIPTSYINKSELGTGKVTIHKFEYAG